MYTIAQIIGVLAVLVGVIMSQQKERKKLILYKLISDFLWIIHFLLMGAFTGALTTSVNVIRGIACYNKDKKFFSSKIFPVFFIILYAIAPIFTWTGFYSILPAISSVLATLAFYNDSSRKTKIILIFVSFSQITYAIAINSISVIINELFAISSIVFFFLRERKRESKI